MFDLLAGNYEMTIVSNGVGTTIPAELLGDLVPNYEEGELSADTQAGTITSPSGKAETSEFTFTLFLPRANAVKYLGLLWPGSYNEPTAEAQKTGNIEIGTKACQSRTPVAINIHNICDQTDDNDIYIPSAIAKIAFNPTFSTSDAVQVEITVYMQPDENGIRFRFGTGDLSQPSRFDPTTGKTVPITASASEPTPAKASTK